MFYGKGFADGVNAGPYSGSAAVAIVDKATAVTIAGKKPAVNNSVPPTAVTRKHRKQDWINGTASEPIVFAWQNVPLWIKVPTDVLPRARSSLLFIRDRLSLLKAANQYGNPE